MGSTSGERHSCEYVISVSIINVGRTSLGEGGKKAQKL